MKAFRNLIPVLHEVSKEELKEEEARRVAEQQSRADDESGVAGIAQFDVHTDEVGASAQAGVVS